MLCYCCVVVLVDGCDSCVVVHSCFVVHGCTCVDVHGCVGVFFVDVAFVDLVFVVVDDGFVLVYVVDDVLV